MPFAGFQNFQACVAAQIKDGKSEESARRICGKLQAEAEKDMSSQDATAGGTLVGDKPKRRRKVSKTTIETDAATVTIEAEKRLPDGDLTIAPRGTVFSDDGTFSQTNEFAKVIEVDKADEDPGYSFVYGAVLVPDKVDKQGDIIDADVIEATAHEFMENSRANDVMHKVQLGLRDAVVVESTIVRAAKGTTIAGKRYPKGTWLAGTRVYNSDVRKLIKDGKLKGYSISGTGSSDS